MKLAPETPTIETLEAMHPLTERAMNNVRHTRLETARALRFGESLLTIIGACAMTDNEEAILEENQRIAAFGKQNRVTALHRIPPWKPRTNPQDWHGLETTDPVAAHRLLTATAEQSGNAAIEFGHTSHLDRYVARIAMGWRGSRNDGDTELLNALRISDPLLPLALKNGMAGDVENALEEAETLSRVRTAPSILLFRGGSDFTTKEAWTEQYKHALRETNGMVIVDVAHGGEQAHDPAGSFGKSALGQLACLQSVISIAKSDGLLPRGVMIEASDVDSPTDPVVPLDEALDTLKELSQVHQKISKREVALAAD